MHMCLCKSGASLVSVVDPQESLFIEHNVEFLQDSARSFWIGLYKNHEGEHQVIAVTPALPQSHKQTTKPPGLATTTIPNCATIYKFKTKRASCLENRSATNTETIACQITKV